jgi:hypothetical protein
MQRIQHVTVNIITVSSVSILQNPVETWAQLVFSGIHTCAYLLNTLILPLKMQEQKERASFLQRMVCAVQS